MACFLCLLCVCGDGGGGEKKGGFHDFMLYFFVFGRMEEEDHKVKTFLNLL